MPGSTTAHIINHTHWDREWFLTSEVTSRWIPGLIQKLEQLATRNPSYRFLFDGQTLVIEDLLSLAPDYAERVHELISRGHLIIGPYYCQPDWQLTGGELLIRNLLYGRQDMQQHGGRMEAGWLVDTFGHISQSPQIHRLFGIDAVYVWRGAPLLQPYFTWQGADGSTLLTINLFGGYRNLYGVTHVPEVAVARLETEVQRLAPYYPTPDIPLFDGYDLEDDPEDPLTFYTKSGDIDPDLTLQESTPVAFAREVAARELSLPTVSGELNSGKYGATFPGTLSARTYLKLMAHDCERLLCQLAEPLAVLARLHGRPYQHTQYESWGRRLLQNAVHDCICGVSIDQVHEKMEYSYRQVFGAMLGDVEASLATLLADFRPGRYAVSTNPFPGDNWFAVGDSLMRLQTEGVGVWPIVESLPIESASRALPSFTWRNDHYQAGVSREGIVRIGDALLGALVVSEERGDTYSAEPGPRLGTIEARSPLTLLRQSERHCELHWSGAWQDRERQVTVDVHLTFDGSPLVRWQIDLDSHGADLRVDMIFEAATTGDICAAMPFDLVRRSPTDADLLPRELPPDLAGVLLGQRELNAVTDFPFRDFLALSCPDGSTLALLSKGTRSYSASEDGTVTLPLRRSVEWLTRAELRDRVGDAGPFFYVPDARCERRVRHEIAVAAGQFGRDSITLQQLNAHYQNPPLVVDAQGYGSRTERQFLQEALPLSSLSLHEDTILARFYNPTEEARPLSRSYRRTDVWGEPDEEVTTVLPKKIVNVQLPHPLPAQSERKATVELLARPSWRVGPNHGRPDPAVVETLEQKITALEEALTGVEAQMAAVKGNERLRLQHRVYVLRRELLEYRLSLLLNRGKLAEEEPLRYEYLYEPVQEIVDVGQALNRLRIKRRIYDYVVQAL